MVRSTEDQLKTQLDDSLPQAGPPGLSFDHPQLKEIAMGLNPKDAVNAAQEIATDSVKKAAGIVESSGEMLKGNVADGVGGIVKSATDIATGAVGSLQNLVGKKKDDAE